MWQVIAGVIQIIFLFLKNKSEKDAEEKKRKDELYVEWKAAMASRDSSRINGVIDRVRNK